MRLYTGMSTEFISDTTHNRIAEKLTDAFVRYYRYRPSPSEIGSWRNSLRAMSLMVTDAELDDHGVMLEYQLPMSSRRLDCLVCAKDREERDQAVIVELKQWDACEESDADDLVCSRLGGRMRDVLHPSVQVGQYQQYLQDNNSAFYDEPDPVGLEACCYLHNYTAREGDVLLAPKFETPVATSNSSACGRVRFLHRRRQDGWIVTRDGGPLQDGWRPLWVDSFCPETRRARYDAPDPRSIKMSTSEKRSPSAA